MFSKYLSSSSTSCEHCVLRSKNNELLDIKENLEKKLRTFLREHTAKSFVIRSLMGDKKMMCIFGGAIRDFLLEIPERDFDIMTIDDSISNSHIEKIASSFKKLGWNVQFNEDSSTTNCRKMIFFHSNNSVTVDIASSKSIKNVIDFTANILTFSGGKLSTRPSMSTEDWIWDRNYVNGVDCSLRAVILDILNKNLRIIPSEKINSEYKTNIFYRTLKMLEKKEGWKLILDKNSEKVFGKNTFVIDEDVDEFADEVCPICREDLNIFDLDKRRVIVKIWCYREDTVQKESSEEKFKGYHCFHAHCIQPIVKTCMDTKSKLMCCVCRNSVFSVIPTKKVEQDDPYSGIILW